MNYQAQNLAAQGRYGDSMLVHMSPREVGGLQALARSQGGSLTTNPDTGLPEAFKLKDLLPTLAGAALTIGSGGVINPMTAGFMVGGFEALRTGNLGRGIMAGLGAFGGGGLGTALTSQGAQALAHQEGLKAIGGEEVFKAGLNPSQAAQYANAAQAAQAATPTTIGGNFQLAGQGLRNIGQPGFMANLGQAFPTMTQKALAATPTALGVMEATQPKFEFAQAPMGESNYKGPYVPSRRDVRFPGQRDTTSEFEFFSPSNPVPGYTTYAASGGMMDTGEDSREEYAEGGQTQERGPVRMPGADYVPGTSPEFNYGFRGVEVSKPTMSMMPAAVGGKGLMQKLINSPEVLKKLRGEYVDLEGYKYNPQTQQLEKMAAGGLTAFKRGAFLQGDGDGMSDSIPAVIGDKQPARLADGEFVVPADVVSHLGNGSSKAGAQRLHAMMDRVRQERTGKKRQAPEIRSERFMPA